MRVDDLAKGKTMKRARKQLKKLCAFLVVTGVALGFLAITPIPAKRTLTFGNVVSDNQSHRALAESIDSSTDASNDINLEILESYVVLPVPYQKYDSLNTISVSLAISNQEQTPIKIVGRGFMAQLVAEYGTVLPLQKSEQFSTSSWCPSLAPGEIQGLLAHLYLFLNSNSGQLELRIRNSVTGGTGWNIEGISPGTYQLNYIYSPPTNLAPDCPEAATEETESIVERESSQLATDVVELRIVEPLKIDSNTVEVDGVRFEMLMGSRTWRIPDDRPSASTPVELGIKITNQTQTPLRFSHFNTLDLLIVGPNGQALDRNGGSNWTIPRVPSDLPLISPGESTTFFLDAKLLWWQNQLRLAVADGFGNYQYFDSLESGTYLFSMGYFSPERDVIYDEQTQKPKMIADFWRGSALTPLVEVRLVEL